MLAADEWRVGRKESKITSVRKRSTKIFRNETSYQNGVSLDIFKPRIDTFLKVWGNIIYTLVGSVTG